MLSGKFGFANFQPFFALKQPYSLISTTNRP